MVGGDLVGEAGLALTFVRSAGCLYLFEHRLKKAWTVCVGIRCAREV